MKKVFVTALCSAVIALPLVACGDGGASSSLISSSTSNVNTILINNALGALRKGFAVTGELTVNTSYFSDRAYQIPDANLEAESITYRVRFIFENSEDYMGVDRRIYELNADGEEVYVSGENAYNANGYAALNYLGYDNVVIHDLALDSNGDRIPYGANGLLNPFTMMVREDFHQVEDGFELNHTKTSVLFSSLFNQVEEYESNVIFHTRLFDFDKSALHSAHLVSENMDDDAASTVSIPSNPYYQTYVRHQYEATLTFDEIGIANAQDVIQAEPEKEENAPLANAIANMTGKEITLTRQLHPCVNGEYVGEDSCYALYHMGEEEGIYGQVYTLAEGGSVPTAPSASDVLLRPLVTGGRLRVYQLDSSTGNFILNSSGYSNLDNIATYDQFGYDISYLNANVFNLNEDGSYSPTIDNVPWITREVFMSTLDTFSAVDSGYVNDVKVYVDEENNCLDRVVATYEDFVGYSGTFTLHYDGLGDSHPSFEINLA